ncbi:MAG TPA: DNA-binding domain-containing protein [Candidatus Polarisedimenticolia bacterium]|nr:DNA-binding domain-containing protein [Candidatus Polarisedimenticolia bacterium]
MNRTALAGTEALFWDLITAPEGVRPGLEALVRAGKAEPAAIESLIGGDDRLPAAERLDIYANMYFFRLLDCLREDFPRLATALGEGRFHNLATDYLLAHPSENPSLRYLGRRLPEFLAGHALARESACLADLARLEWTRADLFDAADAKPLGRDDVAGVAAGHGGDLPLRTVPAFRLLRLDHDAPALWREMRDRDPGDAGSASPPPEAPAAAGAPDGIGAGAESAAATWGAGNANAARLGEERGTRCDAGHVHDDRPAAPLPQQRRRRTAARVWRRGFTVFHRAIDQEEADLLELVVEGTSLSRVAQRLSAGRSQARATEAVGRLLQAWLDAGILAVEPLR